MNRHGIHYEVLNSRKSDEGGRCWEVEVHAATAVQPDSGICHDDLAAPELNYRLVLHCSKP